ncbi:Adagio protein 3 [Blyttiomyces sp. JEL0837]|nr:Adagio protein 3 [Blyttiomyces sp. JEL0837]
MVVIEAEIKIVTAKKEAVEGEVLWEKVAVSGLKFTGRYFHSAVLDPKGTALIVFGGTVDEEYRSPKYPLMRLDLETKVWSALRATGNGPRSLTAHSAVVYGEKMYVLGGNQEPLHPRKPKEHPGYDEKFIFYSLDLDDYVWERPANPPWFKHIEHQSALVYKDEMIAFGGDIRDSDEGVTTDCLFVYNFITKKWSEPPRWKNTKLRPLPRTNHMAWIAGDRMIVAGGESDEMDETGQFRIYHSDMVAFDLKRKIWLGPVKTSNGAFPMPRGSVTYIFGGYCEAATVGSKYYDDGLRIAHVWKRAGDGDDNDDEEEEDEEGTKGYGGELTVSYVGLRPQENRCPIPRAGHTLTMDHSRRREILVGGYNGHELYRAQENAYSDVWELHVTKRADVISDSGIVACGVCQKKGTWRKCAGCGIVAYCGTECQKVDWPDHKADCTKAKAAKGKAGK